MFLVYLRQKPFQGALEELFLPSYHLHSPKLMYLAFLYQNVNLLSEQEKKIMANKVFSALSWENVEIQGTNPSFLSFTFSLTRFFLSFLFFFLHSFFLSFLFLFHICLQPVNLYILKTYWERELIYLFHENKPPKFNGWKINYLFTL